ncbi:MAG: hypothetical protein Q7S48_02050 [bacterium]|nr:hypothetical protein [bacterium]
MSREEEKITKAKKQLLVVGVVCITIVVFTLWLVNLRTTLIQNKKQYSSPFQSLRSTKQELQQSWKEFSNQK